MSTATTNRKPESSAGFTPATGSADLLEIIRAIKMTALSTHDGKAGLAHIVKLCINAEKATGTYLPVNERNVTIKRLTSKHACDSEIRQSNWAMSGYRKTGDRWTCSCGQVYAYGEDEAEGGGWWPQSPATCEHPTIGGLCGSPATHRGMTSGDPLCADCAARRKQWDTEDVRAESPQNASDQRPGE